MRVLPGGAALTRHQGSRRCRPVLDGKLLHHSECTIVSHNRCSPTDGMRSDQLIEIAHHFSSLLHAARSSPYVAAASLSQSQIVMVLRNSWIVSFNLLLFFLSAPYSNSASVMLEIQTSPGVKHVIQLITSGCRLNKWLTIFVSSICLMNMLHPEGLLS